MDTWFKNNLIKGIGLDKYNHSLKVMETSIKLAEIYNYDIDKASIAGLLHDCAKYADKIYLLKRVNDFGIILDDVMECNHDLIHGPLGSIIAETEYKIHDKEILDAIRYHTTGREGMTLLDKIIYISDYIEPSRIFPGVKEVRNLAFINLDKSILLAMEDTLRFLLEKGKLIHIDTVKARNYMLSIKIK